MNIKKNKELLKKNSKEYNKKKFMLMAKTTNLVWSDNDIETKSYTPFTARQIKILDYVATEINEQRIRELEKDSITIKIRDIINFYEFSTAGKLIEDIEKDIKSIADVSAWWHYDEKNPELKTLFRFFEHVDEVEKGDKTTLKISFNEHWLKRLYNKTPRFKTDENTGEVLLDEKGNPIKIPYNFYILDNTKKLKSKYSILLFKECNKHKTEPLGWFDYKLEDIKRDFFMLDKSYGYISSNAIKPAQREINEKTDIHISKIELLPNGKNVEKLRIYLHEKSEEKQGRLLQESFEKINEYVDIQEQQYQNKLGDLKTKTDERKAEKRHNIIAERKDLTAFEDKLKYNPDNQDINEIIKEREEKLNKELNQENIDKFISVSETIKYNKKQHQAKKEYYKGKGIDYIKFLKALKEEEKEEEYWEKLSYKEKVEINKINKRANMFSAFIGKNNLQEKYNEEFLQDVMQKSNLSREEAIEFIEEIEKEIEENTIRIMKETIEKYDKKHNIEKNEENKENGETNN